MTSLADVPMRNRRVESYYGHSDDTDLREELSSDELAALRDEAMRRSPGLGAFDAPGGDDGLDASWARVDLGEWLDGNPEPVKASVFSRDDGECLFYAGNTNEVHADSGVGKSMVVGLGAVQELSAGRDVIWIDFEDPTPRPLMERCRMFGVTDDALKTHLHYHAPRTEFTDEAVDAILDEITDNTTLVVVDSIGEAFGLESINENLDVEVGPWLRRVSRRLADAGPAVVTIDHGTKASDNPLHPSGSKRKRAAITGASYLVEPIQPLTREHGGKLKLTCAKDRHGWFKRGAVAANVDMFVYPDGGVSVKVWPPFPSDTGDGDAKLRVVARAAVRAAKAAGCAVSQRRLLATMNVKGSDETRKAAIELAVTEGALRIEKGERNATMHVYVRDLQETTAHAQ